jgi:hypothetical protein
MPFFEDFLCLTTIQLARDETFGFGMFEIMAVARAVIKQACVHACALDAPRVFDGSAAGHHVGHI